MSGIKSLKEIVESLAESDYRGKDGHIRGNEDFRLLAEIAGVKLSPTLEEVAQNLSSAFSKAGYSISELIKLPQQQRDEIVERAKRDIIELQKRMMSDVSPSEGNLWFREFQTVVDFVVNREKRTVVALLKLVEIGGNAHDIVSRGIAKCAPQDCFNVHIGKAIALRRALNLEVPDEYLNAPQPTEVRVGDIVETYIHGYPERYVVVGTDKEVEEKDGSCHIESIIVNYFPVKTKVIDDSREEV